MHRKVLPAVILAVVVVLGVVAVQWQKLHGQRPNKPSPPDHVVPPDPIVPPDNKIKVQEQ